MPVRSDSAEIRFPVPDKPFTGIIVKQQDSVDQRVVQRFFEMLVIDRLRHPWPVFYFPPGKLQTRISRLADPAAEFYVIAG